MIHFFFFKFTLWKYLEKACLAFFFQPTIVTCHKLHNYRWTSLGVVFFFQKQWFIVALWLKIIINDHTVESTPAVNLKFKVAYGGFFKLLLLISLRKKLYTSPLENTRNFNQELTFKYLNVTFFWGKSINFVLKR